MPSPDVVQLAVVTFDNYDAQWPKNISPQYGFTDFLGEYGASGKPTFGDDYTASVSTDLEMEFNPTIGAVHARRFFVPHNQIAPGYGVDSDCLAGIPSITWTMISNTNPELGPFEVQTHPIDYCRMRVCEPGPAHFGDVINPCTDTGTRYLRYSAPLPAQCQGFTALLYKFTNYGEDTTAPTGQTLRFRCTSGSLIRWFSIAFNDDEAIYIAYTDGDPQTGPYQAIGDIKPSGVSEVYKAGGAGTFDPYTHYAYVQVDGGVANEFEADFCQPGTIPVEILLMAGQLVVNIGGNNLPLTFPQANLDDLNTPLWQLDTVEYLANNYCWLEWSVHPTKFTVMPSLLGAEQDLGFVPTSAQIAALQFQVHYANGGGDVYDINSTGFNPSSSFAEVSLASLVGTILQYQLTIVNVVTGVYRGTEYADCTCCVKSVTGLMPPVVYTGLSMQSFPQPFEELVIDHVFDLSTLSIKSSARIMLDNAYGQWTNIGQTGWCDTHGHVAALIDAGIVGNPTGGLFGVPRQFSGIGNTSFITMNSEGGESHVAINCKDMWEPLDVPTFAYPWFDYRNVYWVMSYLAQQGGCAQARQQFWLDGYVPTNPYAPCPNGAPSYYLPAGPAGTPNTRFASGENIRSIMLKISNAIGFLLFFDVQGVLQFYKFQLPSLMPTGYFFRYYPTQGPGESLSEIWSAEYTSSLEEVRNNITIIGANYLAPAWNPLVVHATDTASINDPLAFNYKGFSASLVWADNIFADPTFAQDAANAVLNYMRMPGKTAPLTTWLQFDQPTYPLDIFYVTDNRAGASMFPYLVTRATTRIRQDAAPTTSLQGRWLPAYAPGGGTSPP